jgi:peptidoglycan/xylan/chitin deacetylase (PgdA/CDA1 family)
VTARGLRILGYHGFSRGDECAFRPGLFMRPELFAARIEYLRSRGYPILDLDEALCRLAMDTLPPLAVVITIDDGFAGTLPLAFPHLRAFRLPATIYVTTFHAVKQSPVFRVVIQYMFWKANEARIDASSLGVDGADGVVDLADHDAREALMWRIVEFGERQLDEPGRVGLCQRVGAALDVPFEAIAHERTMNIMTRDEICAAIAEDVDIQLHTHRHRLSDDAAQILEEISDNRAVLEPLVGRRLQHFCYPSGVWSTAMWPVLSNAGIISATTCDRGFNYRDTPPLALHRFLDGDDVPAIEFEAEMSGLLELLRRVRAAWRRMAGGGPVGSDAHVPAMEVAHETQTAHGGGRG